MNPAADIARERLLEGMVARTPSCIDIDLFTADYIDREDQAVLASICAGCDLVILCRQYAETRKPLAGFWAGTRYGRNTRPSTTGAAPC